MSGFADRISERQRGFKKATDADESRRKREDAAVQLRKQEKAEALMKKRLVGEGVVGNSNVSTDLAGEQAMGNEDAQVLQRMPALVAALTSNDPEAVFNATREFRKLLSVEQDPPTNHVIAAGIVPRFVQLLREISQPTLQFEAAWVLTNIASGTAEQTRCVVEHGALPLFVELVQSPDENVREQAVWALGNIAGDSANFRDLVLQSGGLVAVLTLIGNSTKPSVLKNSTWALSNLCRNKPPPPTEWVTPAFATLAKLLCMNDDEVVSDATWAMTYLTDGSNDRIATVISAGFCPRLVELLGHTSEKVVTPALRAAGNIVTGDDEQTQTMLQLGVIPALAALLSHPKKSIRKETVWTVSNIAAGNRLQIQEVINSNLVPPVLGLLGQGDFDIKKEAVWVISNITAGGSPEQIEYLIQAGCLPPLCELLTIDDSKITTVALDALANMLRIGKIKQEENGLADNPIVTLIEQADGLQKVEQLQEDSCEEVYSKAVNLLETYFPLEEAGGEEMSSGAAVPSFNFNAAMPQGGFNFGA